MAEKNSPGARNAAAAERATAAVGDENAREKVTAAQPAGQGTETTGDAKTRRAAARDDLASADSAADKLQQAGDAGADLAGEAALNPYPEYEAKDVDELRSAAEGRNVAINRDVEKSELVKILRAQDPGNNALDYMTLEQLRGLAGEKGVGLDDDFVKAHLITELRAADTGVSDLVQHAL